jgi:hypothetical protein
MDLNKMATYQALVRPRLPPTRSIVVYARSDAALEWGMKKLSSTLK